MIKTLIFTGFPNFKSKTRKSLIQSVCQRKCQVFSKIFINHPPARMKMCSRFLKKSFRNTFFLLKQSFLETFLSYFMKGSQFKSRAHRRGHHPERDTSDSLSGDQLIRAFQEFKDVSFFFSFFFKESLLCYPHQPWP